MNSADDDRIPAFGLLLRDYAYAYTASHDFTVCDRLMVEDYVLRMGPFDIRGRDEAYKPATEKQYRQYPGLGFTVHDFMTTGDRAALRFSEHGTSVLTGRATSWRGISLYRWDGTRLTECRVEQDYFSRRRQSEGTVSHPVPSPGIDPWTDSAAESTAEVDATVRAWLHSGAFFASDTVQFDDDHEAGPQRAQIDDYVVEILDLFSCGTQAAFHLRIDGVYAGGLGEEFEGLRGTYGSLYASGFVGITDGAVTGHLVTDRLSYTRRLAVARQ